MSRACDVMHLRTVKDYYYGLRLDYEPSPFFPDDKVVYVMRFQIEDKKNLHIANWKSDLKNDPPFTGNGHTSGNNGRLGAPEFISNDYLDMSAGAQIWKVDQNGNETLVAVLENIGGNKKIFKKVIYE
jgi:hypothetical protein